ncbi:MAG TPA: magnesium/cobalt transporter CorA [Candidatus Methanofastidiosa archaeon]|nr:magnesium/cobalt transporter CorA [Candidatus Methanofastidiosa archaeon]
MSSAKKIGSPPGTLVHVGKKRTHDVRITQYIYDKESVEKYAIGSVDDIRDPGKRNSWIDVSGIHDMDIIEKFGARYDIHSLVLEDIMNTHQRPKLEEYEDYLFIVLKGLSAIDGGIELEQVSLLLFHNLAITFQEGEETMFSNLEERLNAPKGKLKKYGSDYLAYAAIDIIVDGYFIILENLAEKIQCLEREVIVEMSEEGLVKIQRLKNELTELRKTIYPLREVMSKLEKTGSDLIKDSTDIYLRDVYDHLVQILEAIETYREMLSGLLEIHLSNMSNKMNEVMKILTIIATIFIPLSFITGVFGMNFVYMPELQWKYSYPLTLAAMFLIVIVMLLFFRKKRWI